MTKTKIKNVAIALLIGLIIGQNNCQAQEPDFLQPLAGPVQTTVAKLKYKDRHPKIYRAYKAVRRGALMASPIVHVGSELCQIGYFVLQFFI